MKILLAMDAEAVALWSPAVREDAVHTVLRDDLAMYLVHELEVVRAECTRDPQIPIGPVTSRFALGGHRDPIRVRGLDVIARGMRVRSRDDAHAQRTASGEQRAKWVALAQPLAAVVERDLRRVVGDNAACAQCGGVRVQRLEVIEPERWIEMPRIVFDERQLNPAHRSIEPALCDAGVAGP